MTPLVAGVDCSTQGTKVLLVDPDSGSVEATGRATHTVTGSGGARETDPEMWWDALRTALAETGRAGELGAISIAGQQHGLVVTDGDGRPLRPAILWNDTRSAPEARELSEALGGAAGWAERIGLVPVPSFTATRWAWLRAHEPEAAAAARAVRLPHDFLTERLSGRGSTDRGDASGTAWWSTRDERYSDEVLGLIELDPALLPDVLGPAEAAGEVTASAAAELGIPAGALVGPGTGDNMGAALGLGAAPGQPVVSLGTSGTAYAVMDERTVDPSGTVAGFADASGRFLPLTATLNATLAVDRVAEWLGLEREAAAGRTEVDRSPLPRRRAHAEPSARRGDDRRAAPLDQPRGDIAGGLRGRRGVARRGASAAGPARLRARPGRSAHPDRRRRPRRGLAADDGAAVGPARARAGRRRAGRARRRGTGGGLPVGRFTG